MKGSALLMSFYSANKLAAGFLSFSEYIRTREYF